MQTLPKLELNRHVVHISVASQLGQDTNGFGEMGHRGHTHTMKTMDLMGFPQRDWFGKLTAYGTTTATELSDLALFANHALLPLAHHQVHQAL